MSAQVVRVVLAILMLVVVIVQFVAIIVRDGYVQGDGVGSNGMWWYSHNGNDNWNGVHYGGECGIMYCPGGSTYRGMGKIGKYVSAGAGFSITALIFMICAFLVHAMICAKGCALKLTEMVWMAKLIDFIWVVHLFICVCLVLASLLLGIGRNRHLHDSMDLAYSFYIIVLLAIIEACIAVVTWRRLHIADYGVVILPSPRATTAPPAYVVGTPTRTVVRSNPIDDPSTWSSPRKY
eukprot:TRINITY_DN41_c1_g1_i1.p1 TRINITY_DN41_c1_g1~~TRINITY_DN41_c1_g1_i1.p1  ORF type:complete len:236 (+),score=89.27 TRINITY_DN41_c1_g1_i1:82-789(+)